jgi:hypothetical protein
VHGSLGSWADRFANTNRFGRLGFQVGGHRAKQGACDTGTCMANAAALSGSYVRFKQQWPRRSTVFTFHLTKLLI